MIRRTRHELIALIALILSIRLKPAPSYSSPEALARACGIDLDLVRQVEAVGMLRSEPSRPGRCYDADDARLMAVVAELLDLGITGDDIVVYGERMLDRCGKCELDWCPTRCDATEVLEEMLRRLLVRAGAGKGSRSRVARIERAIASMRALDDLI